MRISSVFGVRGRRNGARETGQTILEMALMLPLLLLLLVGVIEIGRYAYFDILISNAARAGAQYGAQSVIHSADSAGIKNAAHDDGLAAMTITPNQQCSCSPTATPVDCGGGGIGCAQPLVYVQVQATDTYNSLFSYPGIPRSMTLSSTVTMRVSQ
ncbi:MAG TPA: TadE/TadG family type IV pilus assembly protein [Candidatus Acidoferrum sp.]